MHATLRDMLEGARHHEEGERSVSEEVELRLWESFTADDTIEKRYGGKETARLLRIIAGRIKAIEVNAAAERCWLDDPFIFHQVRTMIDVILEHLRPRGRRVVPRLVRRRHPSLIKAANDMGRHQAQFALTMLEAATEEETPSELPPVPFIRAAGSLGVRLKKRGKRSAANSTKGKRR
jgi:hypothetical protein